MCVFFNYGINACEALIILSFRTLVRNLDYGAVRFLLTSFVEMTR